MDDPPHPSDADVARQRLVEALVATGGEDRAAFRTLYRLTSAKLFGVCLRICGERPVAAAVFRPDNLPVGTRAGA